MTTPQTENTPPGTGAPNGVYAVVVTYEPELKNFQRVLAALEPQVQRIIVVDNHSPQHETLQAITQVQSSAQFLPLEANMGVAHALNIGIEAALSQHAQFVLLMDQDSIATKGMVQKLLTGYWKLMQRGCHVAAVGPKLRDANSRSRSYHRRFALWRVTRAPRSQSDEPVCVDYLITSGSLIPAQVIRDIGSMDASLFIDHVDTEWILRAKAKGL